jgi:hypothetical protein
MTVFIVQDVGHLNFLPAEKFGDLEVLVFGPRSHLALSREIPRMWQKMRDIGSDDWILACGHPFFIAAAAHVQAQLTGHMRMLYWDRQTEQYVKVEVKL